MVAFRDMLLRWAVLINKILRFKDENKGAIGLKNLKFVMDFLENDFTKNFLRFSSV